MKRAAIVGAILLVLAGCSYYGYREYRARDVPEGVLPHVKNASLRLENSLRYETESTGITYRELFDNLGKHVTEIDSRVIDVQTLETPKNGARVKLLLAYMRAIQDTLRAQEAMYRKQLGLKTALDSSEEAYRELRVTSSYGYDYARRSAERANERVDKANGEYQEARTSFRGSVERLVGARAGATAAPQEVLYDSTLVPKVIEKSAKAGGEVPVPGRESR